MLYIALHEGSYQFSSVFPPRFLFLLSWLKQFSHPHQTLDALRDTPDLGIRVGAWIGGCLRRLFRCGSVDGNIAYETVPSRESDDSIFDIEMSPLSPTLHDREHP